MRSQKKAVLLGLSLFTATACAGQGEPNNAQTSFSVHPLITQGSMNVYRRFAPEHRDEMVIFYRDVLGLTPLQPIDLGGGQQMILFGIGGGQIKLASGLKEGRQYHLGEVNEATGIRMFTLFFPDEAALTQRFKDHGYAEPGFETAENRERAALVKDPGGFSLKLVIEPGAQSEIYEAVEVGINVSDLEASGAFYSDFVGLDELPPVKDEVVGATRYPYRHGATTINLWSVGGDLPADTGSAGIQYVVSDVAVIDEQARLQNIAIEEPLGGLPGFDLRFIWLNDPDGVTNYFAQIGASRDAEE